MNIGDLKVHPYSDVLPPTKPHLLQPRPHLLNCCSLWPSTQTYESEGAISTQTTTQLFMFMMGDFKSLGQPGPWKSPALTSRWLALSKSKEELTHPCPWEAEECIFQVQDSVRLLLGKNQTQRSPVSSQAGELCGRATGRAPGRLTCLASQKDHGFPFCLQGESLSELADGQWSQPSQRMPVQVVAEAYPPERIVQRKPAVFLPYQLFPNH